MPHHRRDSIIRSITILAALDATAHRRDRRDAQETPDLTDLIAIAIDGPAASGKTAVGRKVAERLGCRFLDTGGAYRAVTLEALRQGVDLDDESKLSELAENIDIELIGGPDGDRLLIAGADVTDDIRSPAVDRAVSQVSAMSGVRAAVVPQQRRIAAQGPIVMVGRDIGTVVLSDSKVKIYMEASAEIRADRRVREMERSGRSLDPMQVLEDIVRRDRIDSEREDSPLKPADDALCIDTDGLDVGQVVERIMRHPGLS